jgi:hypothetical protein
VTDWTPEEITRYATFHWLQVDNGDGSVTAHVWRSIGGESRYLGTAEQIADPEFNGPAEQIPLVPALEIPENATHTGTTPGAGGVLDKIERGVLTR